MAADRKFLAGDTLVDRPTYITHLRRCARDWERVADGSFYGITRRGGPDTAAIEQARRIRETADRIEARADEVYS